MPELYIGLMSGTSLDGVDAALVEFDHRGPPRLLAAHAEAMPPALRAELHALAHAEDDRLERVARADNRIARLFAHAAGALLEAAGVAPAAVRAIGSHGQTVRHAPDGDEPYTVQLGNPSLLAELAGITVVADFRRRDLAAGGQGAPLAPAFHAAFFGTPSHALGVVNIGGIANLSVLDAEGGVHGFDTGPGNVLLDTWAAVHLDRPIDHGGDWAASGCPIGTLLERMLGEPYFAAPAPKSTGRELFNRDWLDRQLAGLDPVPAPCDVQATLVELSAHSIALTARAASVTELLVCGGGVHNAALMARLAQLAGCPVVSTAARGVDPDYLEAIGFAWLARQTLAGLPGNLPAATGAKGPRILGGIYPA